MYSQFTVKILVIFMINSNRNISTCVKLSFNFLTINSLIHLEAQEYHTVHYSDDALRKEVKLYQRLLLESNKNYVRMYFFNPRQYYFFTSIYGIISSQYYFFTIKYGNNYKLKTFL